MTVFKALHARLVLRIKKGTEQMHITWLTRIVNQKPWPGNLFSFKQSNFSRSTNTPMMQTLSGTSTDLHFALKSKQEEEMNGVPISIRKKIK